MIKIDNLNLKYGDRVIFSNVDLQIPDNKMTIIVGPNGTGKTTLLKLITKEIHADCKITNTFKNVFYLPQKLVYPRGVTTFNYVASILYKNSWKWFLNSDDVKKVDEVLDKLGLLQVRDVLVENISSGEVQKANIALGLLSGADLFLLDEPTSNMDLVNQIKILDIIRELTKNNITSVVIMHDLNLSASYGDYFIGVGQDKNLISAQKSEFFSPEILNSIYNITFKVVNNEEKFYVQIFN